SRCGAGYPSVAAISDTEVAVWVGFAFLPSVNRPQEIYTMAVDRSGATTGWVRQGSISFDRACRIVPRPFRSNVGASAGVYAFEVVPTSEPCAWQVSSASPWIKVETQTSGNEHDVVLYSVEANPGPGPRTGSLTVGEYTLQVIQADPRAIRLSDFVVSPAETTVSSGRGLVSISVRSAGKAEWQITNTTPWLSVLDRGGDFVTLTHAENNTSSERRASLTIAGHTVVIRQMAGDPLRPAIAEGGVVNAASFLTGISSGSWFTVRGVNLSSTTRTWTSADFNGDRLPTSLDGVRVLVNGKPAYVYYVSPTQINALAPEDTTVGSVPIEVDNNGRRTLFEVTLRRLRAPGLFMMPAPVARLAAATLTDGTLVAPDGTFSGSSTRGARAGDAISLYATGLGVTTPAYPEGRILEAPLAIATPTVTIAGRSAKVLYAGLVSPGLYQINIEVPEVPTGEHEIVVTAQGTRTQQRALLFVE
ncbi:MAG TPA: BACON domain-containing carbohydrate-binding protein, partial [Bryobacteraceae bacterium]|nr:BACON domain-containing carbohydrate-binding protein [Bryobacteraceae bacterium]